MLQLFLMFLLKGVLTIIIWAASWGTFFGGKHSLLPNLSLHRLRSAMLLHQSPLINTVIIENVRSWWGTVERTLIPRMAISCNMIINFNFTIALTSSNHLSIIYDRISNYHFTITIIIIGHHLSLARKTSAAIFYFILNFLFLLKLNLREGWCKFSWLALMGGTFAIVGRQILPQMLFLFSLILYRR